MSMPNAVRRIIALADKEWIQIRRDNRSLILSLLVPVFLIIIFGYALTMDVKRVHTVIYNRDQSPLSRSLIEKFSHTEYISVTGSVGSYREIDRLLDSGDITLAVIIPADFNRRFKSGRPADLQVIVDGSDASSALVALGYVKGIVYEFNQEIMMRGLDRAGIKIKKLPVEVRSRIWYNAELESKNFIIPGLVVLIISIISALITSLTISREWERGTMETLITTPVRGFEVVLGKLVPYLLIGIVNVLCMIIIGYFVFGVPFRGSFIQLCLISFLFLFGTSCLGVLISAGTRVQVLAVQIAINVTYMPTVMLSGFIFPVRNMPFIVQGITYIIPAKYMIAVVKMIELKGVGYALLWTQILFLALYAVIVGALAIKKFTVKLPAR